MIKSKKELHTMLPNARITPHEMLLLSSIMPAKHLALREKGSSLFSPSYENTPTPSVVISICCGKPSSPAIVWLVTAGAVPTT